MNTYRPSPLDYVAHPYARRVSVERSERALYGFLITLQGWNAGTNLLVVARSILATLDASSAGAQVAASTETVLWIDVEDD